uniref:Uncharacterized protein n=1 Tax=Daucus carota subsp. sativus TaxID=79200 RepID=A0A164VBG4_DAUCS
MFSLLSTLNTNRTDWRIQVQLSRILPRTSIDGNIAGYNLIMIDNQAEILNLFDNYITVGNIYEFSTFYMRMASGRFRPTRSVGPWSSVCRPLSACLATLSVIYQDVIGIVENIQPLKIIITPRGNVRLIRMSLGDGLVGHKFSKYPSACDVSSAGIIPSSRDNLVKAIITNEYFSNMCQMLTKVNFKMESDTLESLFIGDAIIFSTSDVF